MKTAKPKTSEHDGIIVVRDEWRIIPGFEAYEVSRSGQVRRLKPAKGARPGRLLKPKRKRDPKDDHLYVDLSQDNVAVRTGVHRLMALAFIGPPPSPKHHAAHWNGIGDDNRLDNIRWATAGENALDKPRHGTDRQGVKHPLAKLTEADVHSIRAERALGARYVRIAEKYPVVSVGTIMDICHRRRWQHV